MLTRLIKEWKKWSRDASQEEDGWESDFEDWYKLIETAYKNMLKTNLNQDKILNLAFVFSISSECEELLEFAKENFLKCKENLIKLVNSKDKEVRWQIYEVFRHGDKDTDEILISALKNETDNYALRRAMLSLCDRNVENKAELANKFLQHEDEYIQRVAKELKESATR